MFSLVPSKCLRDVQNSAVNLGSLKRESTTSSMWRAIIFTQQSAIVGAPSPELDEAVGPAAPDATEPAADVSVLEPETCTSELVDGDGMIPPCPQFAEELPLMPTSRVVPLPEVAPPKSSALLPAEVEDALLGIQSMHDIAVGPMDAHMLLEQNIQLMKFAESLQSYLKSTHPTGGISAHAGPGRLTTKNSFGKPGSATGEEVMEMARQRYEERKRKADEEVAKRSEKEEKRRQLLVSLVTTGAELLKKIEHQGPNIIQSLKVDDMMALLHNSDPQGTIKMGRKCDMLPLVLELDTVKKARAAFVEVTTHAIRAAAPQL